MAKKGKKKIHNLFQSVTPLIQVTLQLFLLQLVTPLNITFRQGEKKNLQCSELSKPFLKAV